MPTLLFDDLGARRGDYHVAVTGLRPFRRTVDHDHDFVEAFLVTQGGGVHRINGRVEVLRRGSLCWIEARDRHGFEASAGEGLTFVNVAWRGAWWRRVAGVLGGDPFGGGCPRKCRLEPETARALEILMEGLLSRSAVDSALSLEVLASVVRCLGSGGTEGAGPREPGWLAALESDLADPGKLGHPLAWWVARTGRSREHVARVCRARLGAPLSDLLNRRRLEWVKRGLRTGDRKVADLAMEAGYQNLGYFYRVFRAREGTTPRHWRLAHAGAGVVPR